MAETRIQPLNDRVLVEPQEKKDQVKGGIVIPDSAREKPMEMKVIAVGPGKISDDGKRVPVDVKIGDIVICSKYGGTEIKYNDKEYKLIGADDILAIVE
jgi:chaperonin GroES